MIPPLFNTASNATIPNGWKQLKSAEQLAHLIDRSYQQPVAIFKHSMRCPRSTAALQKTIEESERDAVQIEVHFLDLLKFRMISDAVASRLNVHHQSPQLIVLERGDVVYHASHEAISIVEAAKKLNV